MGKHIKTKLVIGSIIGFGIGILLGFVLIKTRIPFDDAYIYWGTFLFSWIFLYIAIHNLIRKNSFGAILYPASLDEPNFQRLSIIIIGMVGIFILTRLIWHFSIVSVLLFWYILNALYVVISHPHSQTGITAQGIAYRGSYFPWQKITAFRWHDSIREVDIVHRILGIKKKSTLKFTCNPEATPAMEGFLKEKLG